MIDEIYVKQYNILDNTGCLVNSCNEDELDKYIKIAEKEEYTILNVYDDYKVIYPKKEPNIAFMGRAEEDIMKSKSTIKDKIKKILNIHK